jgi:hypothetical protein
MIIGKDKGERLTGTRERDTDDVTAAQDHGEALDLDRCRPRDAFPGELVDDGSRKFHLSERLDGRRYVDAFDDDVPLVPDVILFLLGEHADVRRGFPSGHDGVRVRDVLGELLDRHERLFVVDRFEDLSLFLRELLRGCDGRRHGLEPRGA